MWLNLHWLDILAIALYFAIILYLGVYKGGKSTNNLADFFVAGSKWGPITSFIFIFAAATAGNEAVVISGSAYEGGLSGLWYWWSFLFATPIYYLFATYYRRARVYNLCEFFEMRYDRYAAGLYSLLAGVICILLCGTFLLAISKILAGITGLGQREWVWLLAVVVGAYVYSGGFMSAMLTNLFQGVLCLLFLCFVMLPFLWVRAGGWEALRSYSDAHPEIWDLVSPDTMSYATVLALNLSAIVGGIAAPWIYNWIALSRDEKAATQCGWGHLWKRVITIFFAVYGILFVILKPNLDDPEMAWGIVMGEIVPVGFMGLLIVSFVAAAMSSADSHSTTSSAMFIDYFYRKILRPNRSGQHYLAMAKLAAIASVFIAALTTEWMTSLQDYVKLFMTLLSYLGIPILFGITWRKANRSGMWLSLVGGSATYVVVNAAVMARNGIGFFEAISVSFEPAVFWAVGVSALGMVLGSLFGPEDDPIKLKRFYAIMHTPVGEESTLVRLGIKLPALVDKGLTPDGPEAIDEHALDRYYEAICRDKFFGPESPIELKREPQLPWYYPGFLWSVAACFALLGLTWLVPKMVFVW